MFFEQFPITSRYHKIEQVTMETATGETVAYLRRRFLPAPSRFVLLQEHTVQSGDRLDNVTAQYLGDPLQFWRVADANNAMKPEALTAVPGSKILITQPEGIPGMGTGV